MKSANTNIDPLKVIIGAGYAWASSMEEKKINEFLVRNTYTYMRSGGGTFAVYNTSVKVGDIFNVVHSDGAIITEIVDKVEGYGQTDFMVMCGSCASYTVSTLARCGTLIGRV